MDENKKQITRRSKQIASSIKALMAIMIAVSAAAIVGIIAVIVFPDTAEKINKLLDNNSLIFISDSMADDELVDSPRLSALISLGGVIISYSIYFFFSWTMLGIINSISRGSSPFTDSNADMLRKASYFSLILLLTSDIIIPIFAFLLLQLLSALFRYGAYLQRKADETSRIQEEMIVSFAEITENKSSQTGNHVKRVSEYSRIIAEKMGLPEEECERIRLASTMHDIGKLMIPSQILEKPARLTDEEFAVIKQHSAYGGELLEHVEGDIMQLARTIALDHHERPDGMGYPDGKTLESISVEGRIVAVADVYDALTSKRSYKEAWDPKQAYDEIVKNSGSQFDSKVIEAFKAAYGDIDKARKQYADGANLSFIPSAGA